MAGRSANMTIGGVHSEIESIKGPGMSGVSGSEMSSIGGAGRKGGSAEGMSVVYKDVKSLMNETGNATRQETGPNAGTGKTL